MIGFFPPTRLQEAIIRNFHSINAAKLRQSYSPDLELGYCFTKAPTSSYSTGSMA